MLSARALAEKSADMPRRISLWLASCRSPSVLAVLSFAEAGSPRSAAASKKASVSIRLREEPGLRFLLHLPPLAREVPKGQPAPTLARHLTCAAQTLALRTFTPAAPRPDRTIERGFTRTASGGSTARRKQLPKC